jgi:hypothetical protein
VKINPWNPVTERGSSRARCENQESCDSQLEHPRARRSVRSAESRLQ